MPKIVAEKIDWIKLGFEMFSQYGESGIVVDIMARKLKCNRSSFYWHFSSKEKFINEIIQYWVESDTGEIIEKIKEHKTLRKQFKVLIEIIYKNDPCIDFIFHLKKYSQKRKAIRELINSIDNQRIEFVADLIAGLGYKRAEARAKSKIFYKHLIGYHEMNKGKMQSEGYVNEVLKELKHFIAL